MEEKVETTLSKHSQLISLMKVLGYTSDEDGICNGYAYMGMQALFANELGVFKQRVDHLLNIPLNDFEKEAAIQFDSQPTGGKETKETLLKKILEDYLKSKDLLVDTLAFFDGIELTQQRSLYPHLFDSEENLEQGDFIKFTIPQKIEDKGGIVALPPVLSGAYQQKEMTTEYLTLLREKINAMIPKPTEPVGLAISGHGLRHAITVCFNPKQDKWILIDANTPPAQEYSDDGAIAQALLIEGACSTNGTGVINTRVFTMSGNEPLQHVLTEWMQEVQKLSEQDMATKTKWEDSRGGTLLNTVVYNNNYEHISRLAEQGADVNKQTSDKYTPLLIAIFRNNIESVRELLKCGAAPETDPYNINTPLRVAIAKKNMDIVEMLLKNGADPNFQPYFSQTAFEDAIKQNDYNLVKLMLDYGGRPCGSNFGTVMEETLSRGDFESFKALLEHGFKPGELERDNNLLLLAVQNNQFELAKLLLEYGANPRDEDTNRKESAREYAEKNNLVDFLDLFDHPPEATQKNAAPKDDAQATTNFIDDLKKYCVTRRAEWDLIPKWLHVNKKDIESARFRTKMSVLKFGFSVEDKIKAAEKLIDALENKEGREPLSDFDIAALLSSRLYSTVVAKHKSIFNALEEVIDYKNRTQENKAFSNRAA